MSSMWDELQHLRQKTGRQEKQKPQVIDPDLPLRLVPPARAESIRVKWGWDFSLLSCNNAFMHFAGITAEHVNAGLTKFEFFPEGDISQCIVISNLLKTGVTEKVVRKTHFQPRTRKEQYASLTITAQSDGIIMEIGKKFLMPLEDVVDTVGVHACNVRDEMVVYH